MDTLAATFNIIDVGIADPPNSTGEFLFEASNNAGVVLNGQPIDHSLFSLFMSGSTTEPTETALPATPPNLANFPSIQTNLLLADFTNGTQDILFGWSMETLTLVPEPGSGFLLSVGLAGCLAIGARRAD